MKQNREKKKTLKKRLITVVTLICVLQLLFLVSGYLFVLNNLSERAEQRAASAFERTLSDIDAMAQYADNIEEITTKAVRFSLLSRSRYEQDLANTTASLNILCNMLQAGTADNRVKDVIIYFPDDRIYVSGLKSYRLYDETLLTIGDDLYALYSGRGGKFVEYAAEGEPADTYYIKKFSDSSSTMKGVYLYVRLEQNYFSSMSAFDDSGAVVLYQGGKMLFSTRPELGDYDAIYAEVMNKNSQSGTIKLNGENYYAKLHYGDGNQVCGVYIVERGIYYEEIYKFLMISVSSVLINIAVWIYFSRNLVFKTVYGPVMDLVNNLEKVKNNDYSTVSKRFDEQEWDEVTSVFNMMVTKINNNVKETYQKDLLMKNMELKFLQSQINPHFLYNTLDSIAYKANNGEIVDVNRITGYLSKMYRLVFNKGNDFLEVSNIMLCCEMFLKICEFKYTNFKFELSCADDVKEVEALNLIVQTVLENAVVHGYSADKPDFTVTVDARRDGDRLIFTVTDTGKGFDSERLEIFMSVLNDNNSRSESGLVNAQKRVRLYYGDGYGINIESERGKYTRVTITMSCVKPEPELPDDEDYDEEEEE